jgi:uncharacterized protein YbcC (UPF0753/DUF2309 family)
MDTDLVARRARLLVELDEAARPIAPLWPLGTFIAVNPLWDLRQLGFDAALRAARQWFPISGYPSPTVLDHAWRAGRITSADLHMALLQLPTGQDQIGTTAAATSDPDSPDQTGTRLYRVDPTSQGAGNLAAVNREVAKWCAAYMGAVMPDAAGGFFRAWRSAIGSDPGAARLAGRHGRARLAGLPPRPEDSILACLGRLGRPVDEWAEELTVQLAAMPGWAGHAKWRSRWAPASHPGPVLQLVDYVAVRLAYDTELRTWPGRSRRRAVGRTPSRHEEHFSPGTDTTPTTDGTHGLETMLSPQLAEKLLHLSSADLGRVWLEAYEGHYRDQLLGALERPGPPEAPPFRRRRAAAQVVCCIDARSEGLRRHLEAVGEYETYGFAGFFGLPLRYHALGAAPVDLCPVLLTPTVDMGEQPSPGAESAARRRLGCQQAASRSSHAFGAAREGSVSPFALAEAGGFLATPVLVAKTVSPTRYRRLAAWAARRLVPPTPTVVAADPDDSGMGDAEQALFAETALVTMGLTQGFAPLVVLCGHGSTTENNPHASALDCGACGGNRGAKSARAAAAIFNRPEVRHLLGGRGIAIPADTWFVAAEHDTATDRVQLLDSHLVPQAHRAALAALAGDMDRAGAALAAERCGDLPGATPDVPEIEASASAAKRSVLTRSADWAEIQPEWGLAGNAAFIVGPRALTSGVDLQRRAFLHSYDPDIDRDGTALETILTAPMVVAHWINAQYYFSTVDPAVFSAGDKTVHNVVAGMGVTEGAEADLKVGLPLQSLFAAGRPYHEPLRLLTVVQAPLERLDAVIARNPVLQELFDGRWVHLAARPGPGCVWHLRRTDGTWTEWTAASVAWGSEKQVSVMLSPGEACSG